MKTRLEKAEKIVYLLERINTLEDWRKSRLQQNETYLEMDMFGNVKHNLMLCQHYKAVIGLHNLRIEKLKTEI